MAMPDTAYGRLDQCRQNHPQGNSPNCLYGKNQGILTLQACKTTDKTQYTSGCRFAFCIKDCGYDYGKKKIENHQADASCLAYEPGNDFARVGNEFCRQFLGAFGGKLLPFDDKPRSQDGNIAQPFGWRCGGRGGQRSESCDDFGRFVNNGCYGQIQGNNKQQQKRDRHHHHGKPASSTQEGLYPQHGRPGCHNNDNCPDQRGQKGTDCPETGGNQQGYEYDLQRGTGNFTRVSSVRIHNRFPPRSSCTCRGKHMLKNRPGCTVRTSPTCTSRISLLVRLSRFRGPCAPGFPTSDLQRDQPGKECSGIELPDQCLENH